MTFNRKTLSGGALVVLIVLFVALVLLVNVLFRGARVDLTENNLYTLSDGTRDILSSLEEPVNLYLFYSDKGTQNLPQFNLRIDDKGDIYAEGADELIYGCLSNVLQG